MQSSWKIIETAFSPRETPKFETLFSLGNGYLGIRGVFEEHTPIYKAGTFINGFYETEPIVYGEWAYGYPELKQQMIPLAEATEIKVFIDNHALNLETGEIQFYRRYLDMGEGILAREITWNSPGKKAADIRFERLVSFRRPNIAVFRITIIPKNSDMDIGIESLLSDGKTSSIDSFDPRVGETLKKNPLVVEEKTITDGTCIVRCRTRNSGLALVCSMQNEVSPKTACTESLRKTPAGFVHRFDLRAARGSEVRLEKTVCYTASVGIEQKKIGWVNRETLKSAVNAGYELLAEEQREYLAAYWEIADVRIASKEKLQEGIRFNIFHLHQAAGKTGNTGIPAKGLTGEGYGGHYFWDTEIYMFPFFLYTNPETAGELLMFRYNTLPMARERARTLHHSGALFPWRTINGNEASAYFPAGTAQYHINADIAYTIKKYVENTADFMFLAEYGAEIVFETARFWADLTDYIPGKGYCFNEVTGPDEYTACVNNNSYTNYMARENLEYAIETVEYLKKNMKKEYYVLSTKIRLKDREIEKWREIEENVYLPKAGKDGVIPQDDTFLEKAVWDFDATSKEEYPLLLHYHPLTIYRYQVLKQPDVVLAMFLLGKRFSGEQKKINYTYYDPLTTGDSSLSFCIQAIMAAEIGEIGKAHEYFIKSARMDLDDINQNVKDGIHAAAMGGTWLSLVYGFAGLRDDGGRLSFDPHLPPGWEMLSFNLAHKGNYILKITLKPDKAVYHLLSGDRMEITHAGKQYTVKPTEETVCPI